MEIDKKDRTQLKNYFKSNATPTEQNFGDLIDAGINQKEDGIARIPQGPIAIESSGTSEELIHFYKSFKDPAPSWTLAQKKADKDGLDISNMGGETKLYIDGVSGNTGIGHNLPQGKLHLLEKTGSKAGPDSGSLILDHSNALGQNSLVFRNRNKANDHWGHISYMDDVSANGSASSALLTIANNGADNNDHIALMPSGNVGIGTINPASKLHVFEAAGTKHSAARGSITLEHGDQGGQSSIVFRSRNNGDSDYGYIAFQDDSTLGGAGEANLLSIGVSNDTNDHIALLTNGNVGVGIATPNAKLHIYEPNGTPHNPNTGSLLLEHGNPGGQSSIVFRSRANAGGDYGYISYLDNQGTGEQGVLMIGVQNDGDDHLALMPSGSVGIGTTLPYGKLHIYEASGTAPNGITGSLVLEHGNPGGQSSILFRSQVNLGSDYGYISYLDNQGTGEQGLLTIGIQNDGDDHIALMPSGGVGVGVTKPWSKFHVKATGNNVSTNSIVIYNENPSTDQDAAMLIATNGANSGSPYITMDVGNVAGWTFGVDNRDNQSFKWSDRFGSLSASTRMTLNRSGNLGIGTTQAKGRLHLFEDVGSKAYAKSGSLVLEHGDSGGTSSIVFCSRLNYGSDYGYISYKDNQGSGENSLLIIGNENDGDDHIALMPKGNIGFGRTNPRIFLDVKNGAMIGTGETIGGQHDDRNRGVKVRFGAVVDEYVGMDVVLKGGTAGCGNSADLTFNTWECNTSTSREVMRINGTGNVGVGIAQPAGRFHIYEAVGTRHNCYTGSMVLEHGDQGGMSSVVFRSRNNGTSDYGYISYQDDQALGSAGERAVLTIGTQNDGDDNIALMPSGCVGINTINPLAPLHIAGGRRTVQMHGNGALMNVDTYSNTWDNNVAADLSIFAEQGIGSRYYFVCHLSMAMSDARIKNVLGRSEAQQDLAILNQIKVTDYTYKDEQSYGNKVHKKLIAQELEEVYPEAVNQRGDIIPDILQQAIDVRYSEEKQQCEIWINTKANIKKGDQVEIILADGKRELVRVEEAGETHFSYQCAADPGSEVFVYGRAVSDFRYVDYDALTMLGISAIQALSAELNELKTKIKQLESLNQNPTLA